MRKFLSAAMRCGVWMAGSFFILGIIILLLVLIPDAKAELVLDILKIIGTFFIAISVGIAAAQFRFNRKQVEKANLWNKKQLAITQMHNSRKIIKQAIADLHGYFEVLERKNPYELYEIHDIFGVKLNDGSFVFHSEQTQEDIKKLPKQQPEPDKYRAVQFREDVNGRKVKDTLLIYLGEFEYLCSGINNDVFDEKTIETLLDRSIVRAYDLFQHYINHLRDTSQHGEKIYKELEIVANKFRNRLQNKQGS